MEVDYSELKPGVHLFVGDKKIKSLSVAASQQWLDLGLLSEGRNKSAETLLASVAWVHIALTHRRNMIGEISVDWEHNQEAVEQPPFMFNIDRELPRIDQAVQLGGVAYLYKLRRGARMLGLRWLDPDAVTPDDLSLTVEGYGRYWYTTVNGPEAIMAKDLIRIYNPGQREHDPEPSAGKAASLAGQILLGMGETADTFFDTNGLPIIAVIVPDATAPEQIDSIQDRFRRLFQSRRSRSGNKTVGLREGTKIEKISFAPKDLAMTELEDSKIDAILLAHGVPPAITRRDVNRAEAELKMMQFVGTVAARLQMITNTINEDPDIARGGVLLAVHKERHEMLQQLELTKAESLQKLTGRPVMTVNEARERLDLDPVQGGDEIAPAYQPPATQQGQEQPDMEARQEQQPPMSEAKAAEIGKLRRFIASGGHLKRPFHSDVLTPLEIDGIMMQEGAFSPDAPFQGYP